MRRPFEAHNMLLFMLLTLVAVLLLSFGIARGSTSVSDLAEGIGIELAGSALLFFLVDRMVRIREFDTAHQLAMAVERLERHSSFLKGPEQNPPFDEVIRDAKDVWLLGNSYVRLLRSYEAALLAGLENGLRIRLIFLDPDGVGARVLAEQSGRSQEESIRSSLRLAITLREHALKTSGKVEIKLLEWPTSMGLHIIDPDKRHGYLRATLYAPDVSSPLSNRSHFVLRPEVDTHWFPIYVQQYDRLWRHRARNLPDSFA